MRKYNIKPIKFKLLHQKAKNLLTATVKKKKIDSNVSTDEFIHELEAHQDELQMQNDELQHALRQLEASQNRYLELYEFSSVGYLSLDEKNRILEANLTAIDLLGIEKSKLLKKYFSDFINRNEQDTFFLHCRKSFSTKIKQTCELRLIKKDGSWFYAHIESIVAENTLFNRNQLLLSIIDITKQKQTDEQLRQHQFESKQAEKINALGVLASTLAHELAQPITAANNFISGCMLKLDKKPYPKKEIQVAMEKAKRQIERAGNIIHHTKDFVRKKNLFYKTIDINQIIKKAVYLIKQESLSMAIEISLQLPDSPTLLSADKIEIEQVLINLMHNSIEAMTNSNIAQPQLIIRAMKINNDFIKISVSDTGPGIKAEIAERIFEPFFTTKPEGLGIGLAICHNIIATHGGELYKKDDNSVGACFEFTLPITQNVEDINKA